MARRIRTVGAVVVANPRRKHRRKKGRHKARRNPRHSRRIRRKAHRKARRNPRKSRKSRRKARGHRKARRNPRRRKARGHRRARRNPRKGRKARRNPGRKGRRIRVRGHSRRRAKRNPGYGRRIRASAITNPRRHRRYRRNPGSLTSGLERMAGRVPVVGPLFAGMVGLALPAAVGAVSLEPAFQLAKWSVGQSWVPQSFKDSELVFFSVSGLLMGAAFAWLAPKTKFVSKDTASTLAVGIAGAGAGAGYVLWRLKSALATAGVTTAWQELLPQAPVGGLGALLTAQGQTLGALNVSGYAPGYGMAPAYSVGPQGSFGPGGYGGFVLGAGAM